MKPTSELKENLKRLQKTLDDEAANFYDLTILGGDFNARVGVLQEMAEETTENTMLDHQHRNMDPVVNDRGKLLTCFMQKNGFILLNGRCPSDTPANFTFSNVNGASVIDLLWIKTDRLELISNLEVIKETTGSDHQPVILSISVTSNTPSDNTKPNIVAYPSIKWKDQPIMNKQIFYSELAHSFRQNANFDNNSTDQLYQNFCDAVYEAAENASLLRPNKSQPSKPKKQPWYDNEADTLRKECNSLLKLCLSHNFDEPWRSQYQNAKKHFKNHLIFKKKRAQEALVNNFNNVRNPVDFWKAVRKLKPYVKATSTPSIEHWNEFYRQVYPPKTVIPRIGCRINNPTLDAPISREEMQIEINKLKNNKATGLDGIANEILKLLPDNWQNYTLNLFNRVLETETCPTDWSKAILSMIYKKGSVTDPANYRRIALINHTTKLFTSILRNRLEKWAETNKIIPECQFGFRRNRSCTDAIFTLITTIQLQLRLKKREVYCLFVDFKRAFDTIPHEELWNKLVHLNISNKIINVIQSLYEQARVQVRQGSERSEEFEVTEGVLQGESMSALLFVLYIYDIEKFFRNKKLQGLSINGTTDLLLLLYADNTAILAYSHVDLAKKIKCLKEYCAINKLLVNISKTKIMIYKTKGKPKTIKEHLRSYEGHPIEVVKSFTYLGVHLTPTTLGQQTADFATNKAVEASNITLGIIKRSGSSSMQTSTKLYESMVQSTLLYAIPAWDISYRNQLERVTVDFFKKLLHLPKCTANWAIRLELNMLPLDYKVMEYT